MFGGYPAIPLDLPQKVGSSKYFPQIWCDISARKVKKTQKKQAPSQRFSLSHQPTTDLKGECKDMKAQNF